MKRLFLAMVIVLAGCGPTFAPGWYPVINDRGVPVMGVDHPDTARRYGLAEWTVVTCDVPGGVMHTSVGVLDRLGPAANGLQCRPYTLPTGT